MNARQILDTMVFLGDSITEEQKGRLLDEIRTLGHGGIMWLSEQPDFILSDVELYTDVSMMRGEMGIY